MRYFLVFTILLSQLSYGQQCPNDSLFHSFKKDVQIEIVKYKRIGWDDETKESYYSLLSNCPIDVLVRYVNDPIPDIRVAIFEGLFQKGANIEILSQIAAKHKLDTAVVEVGGGDVVRAWTVASYFQFFVEYYKTGKKARNRPQDFNQLLMELRNRFRIVIPGERHGFVSRTDLLTVDTLTCSLKGFRVESFSVSTDLMQIDLVNQFTGQIKEVIRDMRPGDALWIDNIQVVDSAGRKKRVPAFVLYVQ